MKAQTGAGRDGDMTNAPEHDGSRHSDEELREPGPGAAHQVVDGNWGVHAIIKKNIFAGDA